MSESGGLESCHAITPGQVVGGKWRIVRVIGRGGMGTVYEAQNVSIGKRAALKFVDAEFAYLPEVASRFQREAEAASLVESAHIVQIFDSGTTDSGVPYIVMELLRGEDLRTRLRRLGRLAPAEAVHVIAQTLRGLHRAHEAGIVHRDLKPDNIFLVDRDDDPLFAKVLDFGISKVVQASRSLERADTITRNGVVLGTPAYMSPEQAQAMPDVDSRTDLWAAGAILFECLVGRPPFVGHAYESIVVSICTADPPLLTAIDPTIPSELAAIVKRSLIRDRAERFQSAREMLEALQSVPGCSVGILTPLMAPRGVARDAAGGPRDPSPILVTQPAPLRRSSMLLLGGAVMAAGFLLTLGILAGRARSRTGRRGTSAAQSPPAAVVMTQDAGTTSAVAERSESSAGTSLREEAAADATPARNDGAASSSPLRPTDRPHGRRSTAAGGSAAGSKAAAAAGSAALPLEAPDGIAGGLRIKTNYP